MRVNSKNSEIWRKTKHFKDLFLTRHVGYQKKCNHLLNSEKYFGPLRSITWTKTAKMAKIDGKISVLIIVLN